MPGCKRADGREKMGVIAEEPHILGFYRRGAYREMLHVIRAKNHYTIHDLLLAGLAHFKLKEFPQSRQCVDFVIDRSSDIWARHARFIRAQISIIEEDWQPAIDHLEALLSLEYPYENHVGNSLAYAHWQNGQSADEAILSLERVLQSDADNASALNSLGFILAETDTDLPKARNMCERANQLKTDYSPYLDSFGWALYKLGERAKAVYTLRKAMILSPENQEVRKHLQCAAKLGPPNHRSEYDVSSLGLD